MQHFPNGNGWLIRDYMGLEDGEQMNMYNSLIELSKGSDEHEQIRKIPLENPFPFAYHNLQYTNTSNVSQAPEMWYTWASKLWNFMLDNKDKVGGFSGPIEHGLGMNSVYAQLFGKGGSLKVCAQNLSNV